MISVFIAGPVRAYREGLTEALDRQDDVTVVGAAGNVEEIVARVEALAPDIVLYDPADPGSNDTIRDLTNLGNGVKVAALGVPENEPEVIACAEAGVAAFVTRDDSLAALVETIRSAARGELLVTPKTAATLLSRVAALGTNDVQDAADTRLTPRETEVFGLIAEGLSNKQIARRLCIELPTVKQHVHHILEKLQVSRRGEAVARLRGLTRTRPDRSRTA
jgi:two-component system, NarL family, nitrate/nitrite response regulator NarL